MKEGGGAMLADGNNDDRNPPMTVEQRYESACGAQNLRLSDAEMGGGAVDVLIASGGAAHIEDKSREANAARVGMSLLRLHSEFSGAAKPQRLSAAQILALAERFKAGDEAERTNRERENGELDRLRGLLAQMNPDDEGRADLLEKVVDLESLYERGYLPLPEVRGGGNHLVRARAHAAKWYASELRILAQSLKSRPVVWAQLLPWAQDKGIPEEQVAKALFHWLSPTCERCDGHGLLKAPDAPALSAKQCRACNGTGTKMIPDEGGRVIGHISYCISQARASIGKRLRATRE